MCIDGGGGGGMCGACVWWWCVNGACSGSSGSRIAWGVDGCVVRVVMVMVVMVRSHVCVM